MGGNTAASIQGAYSRTARETRGTADRCSFRSDVLRKIRAVDMCRPTADCCCLSKSRRSYSFSFFFFSLSQLLFLPSVLFFLCSRVLVDGRSAQWAVAIDCVRCQSLIGKDGCRDFWHSSSQMILLWHLPRSFLCPLIDSVLLRCTLHRILLFNISNDSVLSQGNKKHFFTFHICTNQMISAVVV